MPAVAHKPDTEAALRKALRNLLNACLAADCVGELHEAVDGSLLDAAGKALSDAEGREWIGLPAREENAAGGEEPTQIDPRYRLGQPPVDDAPGGTEEHDGMPPERHP